MHKGEYMSDKEKALISKAKRKYGRISFCGVATTWKGCITTEGNVAVLWFNTADGSTHIETDD
jgi:hypothetical protein